MSQTRRLAPILAADLVGYSRMIGADEACNRGFVGQLQRCERQSDLAFSV